MTASQRKVVIEWSTAVAAIEAAVRALEFPDLGHRHIYGSPAYGVLLFGALNSAADSAGVLLPPFRVEPTVAYIRFHLEWPTHTVRPGFPPGLRPVPAGELSDLELETSRALATYFRGVAR